MYIMEEPKLNGRSSYVYKPAGATDASIWYLGAEGSYFYSIGSYVYE